MKRHSEGELDEKHTYHDHDPNMAKSGAILAITISAVLAGSISSCSMVPRSRSRIIVASATRDALRSRVSPNTPVTTNQEPFRPGL